MSDLNKEAVSNEMWRCEPCSTFHYVGTECPYKNYYAVREVAEDVSEPICDGDMMCSHKRCWDVARKRVREQLKKSRDEWRETQRSKLKPEPTPTQPIDEEEVEEDSFGVEVKHTPRITLRADREPTKSEVMRGLELAERYGLMDAEPTPTEISDLTAREIKAFRHLLTCSKRVYGSFMNGNHPSDRQLLDLDGAIEALEVMKICGHRAVEDCSC